MRKLSFILTMTLLFSILTYTASASVTMNDWLRIKPSGSVIRGIEDFSPYEVDKNLPVDGTIGIDTSVNKMIGSAAYDPDFWDRSNKVGVPYTDQGSTVNMLRYLDTQPYVGDAWFSFRVRPMSYSSNVEMRHLFIRGGVSGKDIVRFDLYYNGTQSKLVMLESNATATPTRHDVPGSYTQLQWHDFKIRLTREADVNKCYVYIDGTLVKQAGITFLASDYDVATSKFKISYFGMQAYGTTKNVATGTLFDDIRVSNYAPPTASNASLLPMGNTLTANFTFSKVDGNGVAGTAIYEWYKGSQSSGDGAEKIIGQSGSVISGVSLNGSFYRCKITPVDSNGITGIPVWTNVCETGVNITDWLRIKDGTSVVKGIETFEGFNEGALTADLTIGINGLNNMNGTVKQDNAWNKNKYLSPYISTSPVQWAALRFIDKTANPILGDPEISFRAMLPAGAAANNGRFLAGRGAVDDLYNIQTDYSTDGTCKLKQLGGTNTLTVMSNKWFDVKIIIKNNSTSTTSYTFIDGVLLDSNGYTNSNAANIANGKILLDWLGFDNQNGRDITNTAKFDDIRVITGYRLPLAKNPVIMMSGNVLTANYEYASPDISGQFASEGNSTFEWYVSNSINGENAIKISDATQKTYNIPAGGEDKYYTCKITPIDSYNISGISAIGTAVSPSNDPDIGKVTYVDNSAPAPAFVYSGAGTPVESNLVGYNGSKSCYSTNSTIGDSVTWTPQGLTAGYYEVYINVMNQIGNVNALPPKDILIEVSANGKTTPAYRDFRYVSGWQALGAFEFNGDGTEFVKQTKAIKEKTDNSYFRFDDIKVVKVSRPKILFSQPVISYNGIDLTKSGLVGGDLKVKTTVSATNAKDLVFAAGLYFGNQLISMNYQEKNISTQEEVILDITVPDPCAGYYIRTFIWDHNKPVYESGLLSLKGYFGLGGFKTDMPNYQGDMDYTQGRADMEIGDVNDTTYFYPEYENPLEFNMRSGLPNTIAKLEAGQPVSVAYIGGSITEQNGWRPRTTAYLKRQYPNANITEISAGLSGTGSDLGVSRYQVDVLSKNPDLVFIEFAGNDSETAADVIKKSMEGMIRKTWAQNPNADVCFVYTTKSSNKDFYLPNSLLPMPTSTQAQDEVATYYNIPTIHFGYKVMDLANDGKLLFQGSSEPQGTILFSNDGVHPLPKGDQIYAGAVARSYQKMLNRGGWSVVTHQIPAPIYADNFETAKLYDINQATMLTGTWDKIATSSIYPALTKCYTDLFKGSEIGSSIKFTFNGTAFGIFDMGGPESGIVEFFVDGVSKGVVDRFTSANDHYRQEYYIISGLTNGVHNVEIKVIDRSLSTRPNKRDIIGRKDLYDANPEKYVPNIIYLGKIIVMGTMQ